MSITSAPIRAVCPISSPMRSRSPLLGGVIILLLLFLLASMKVVASESAGNQLDPERGAKTPQIDFIGNKAFSSVTLLNVLLQGKPRWFTESGSLNRNVLRKSTDDLVAFYYNNGFLAVKVDKARIVSKDHAIIEIDEGSLYHFGSIAVAGRLVFPLRDLEAQLTMKSGHPFRGPILQHDEDSLVHYYSNRGFAFVTVDPRVTIDSGHHLVNVKLFIEPRDEIWINRITIFGNTRTPAQIIRAALRIHEHELYSERAFRESKARLDGLGLFSEIQITTRPSTKPGQIDVNVIVVEKSRKKSALLNHSSSGADSDPRGRKLKRLDDTFAELLLNLSRHRSGGAMSA
jgi:outer membrane protein assembly factor BamA